VAKLVEDLKAGKPFRKSLRISVLGGYPNIYEIKLVEDLKAGKPFRKSLRISVLGGYPNIYEMTWGMPHGRATFMFGAERVPGEQHIIWRRSAGTRSITIHSMRASEIFRNESPHTWSQTVVFTCKAAVGYSAVVKRALGQWRRSVLPSGIREKSKRRS
jgi:hypothetical protein